MCDIKLVSGVSRCDISSEAERTVHTHCPETSRWKTFFEDEPLAEIGWSGDNAVSGK